MDFITATTTYVLAGQGNNHYATAAYTVYMLTDKAVNLINFFVQFFTASFGLVFALVAVIILLLIFKP